MSKKYIISNNECISLLNEINGELPTNYFIAKNKGKDKKLNYAYLVNVLEDTYQLIPIKRNKKEYSFNTENIITLSKTEDIKMCIILVDISIDYFIISLSDNVKIKLEICKKQFDKNRKSIFSAFAKQFKKQSRKQQILYMFKLLLRSLFVLFIAIGLICVSGLCGIYAYNVSELKTYIKENEEKLNDFLEPYDKADLKLQEDYTTVQHGNIKLDIPSSCYNNVEYSDYEDIVYYDNGLDSESDDYIYISINYEPLDTYDEEMITNYKKMSQFTEREFGFPINSYYDAQKALWAADYNNINYFNYNEVVLYSMFLTLKSTSSQLTTHNYNIENDNHCGFAHELSGNGRTKSIITIFVYPNSNQHVGYSIQVMSKDLDQAYAILNSLEIVE